MKTLTVKIPESKIDFFLELVNQLGFEVDGYTVSEEVKTLVRNRIKDSKKEDTILWNEARKQLAYKK